MVSSSFFKGLFGSRKSNRVSPIQIYPEDTSVRQKAQQVANKLDSMWEQVIKLVNEIPALYHSKSLVASLRDARVTNDWVGISRMLRHFASTHNTVRDNVGETIKDKIDPITKKISILLMSYFALEPQLDSYARLEIDNAPSKSSKTYPYDNIIGEEYEGRRQEYWETGLADQDYIDRKRIERGHLYGEPNDYQEERSRPPIPRVAWNGGKKSRRKRSTSRSIKKKKKRTQTQKRRSQF